jgi:hypothetical protein
MPRRLLLAAAIVVFRCLDLAAQTPTHTQDLRDWRTLGLPVAATWNTGGYTWQYHVDQVRQGHRFLPSIRVPASSADANTPAKVDQNLLLTEDGWAYLRANNVPICLRTTNLAEAFVLPLYRLPKVATNIPKSPIVWSMKAGVLDDEKISDNFGPPSIWGTEGNLWAKSYLLQTLQTKHPSPAYLVLVDNNEVGYEKLSRYVKTDSKIRNAFGYPTQTWLPPATLLTLSIRMNDRVAQLVKANPNASPHDFLPEYWSHRKTHYSTFFAGFNGGLDAGWKDKLSTVGYRAMDDARAARPAMFFDELGYAPELTYFDAGCEPVYCSGDTLTDFTSADHLGVLNLIPAWETARKRNPKAYRELSLFFTDGAAYVSAKAGRHEVMTPARYEGYIQWLLWSIHDPGVPVILRRFSGNAEKPGDLLFRADQFATLDQLGASELKSATSETYLKAIISAVNRVCSNATLRNFWLKGTPVVVPGLGHPAKQTSTYAAYPQAGDADNRWRFLECSANPPRANWKITGGIVTDKIKVWAVATRLTDSALVFAWSPCKLAGTVNVTVPNLGTFKIDAPQPWGYWVVKAGATPVPVKFP